MEENQSIMTMREYGEIHIRLRELLEQRNMKRNELARAANTRFEVVDKWYQDRVEKIDLDVLARFCFVLGCGIEDILEYRK
jgi:DNA-binding Xre family transcriptional regulator